MNPWILKETLNFVFDINAQLEWIDGIITKQVEIR